jgi:hypothetical protein
MAKTLADLLFPVDPQEDRQGPGPRLADVKAHLDALGADERVAQCRTLGKQQQRRLWELAQEGGGLALAPDDLVAPGDGGMVRWYGRNSLPLFRVFEKHFIRHDGAVVGLNAEGINWLVGPGYFTCVTDPGRPGEVLIDYTRVPAQAPSGWRPARSNSFGVSFFVYRNMHDYLRRVSDHVVIGAATRLGNPIGQYFVLARK